LKFKNKELKVICIIQARMGSKRLPGKSLKLMLGKPMLERIIDNIKGSKYVSKFVVATTRLIEDNPIDDLCNKLKIECFRGDEFDVLSRFVDISISHKADIIVRLTADNPFVEKTLLDYMLEKYNKFYTNYDYVHNVQDSGFPFGLFIEIFRYNALLKAKISESIEDKEHVTMYFRKNTNEFNIALIKTKNKFKYNYLTVDSHKDFIHAEGVMSDLYKTKNSFTFYDLMIN
jgi:spore coat polysaccharide biosynthesis protein SpsF